MSKKALFEQLKHQIPSLKQGDELLLQAHQETAFWPSPLTEWPWPRRGLSLFIGERGLGMTSWWLHTARAVAAENQWSLWVEEPHLTLYAPALWSQGFPLSQILVLRNTSSHKNLLWSLHEILQSQIFRWIALPFSHQWNKRDLQWLARLSETHQAHVIMMSTQEHLPTTLFAFFRSVLAFKNKRVHILKSKQGIEGLSLESQGSYASLLSQFSSYRLAEHQRSLSTFHSPAFFSRTGAAVG